MHREVWLQLVFTFAVVAGTVLLLIGLGHAASRTVPLTADEELALAYLTERENARRAGQLDDRGVPLPLPLLTADQVLLKMVRQDFANATRNMDAELQQVITPLKAVNVTEQLKALDTLSPALKARAQQRLAQ